MASLPSLSTTSPRQSHDLPCLEYLLRRFDKAGLARPTVSWEPAIDSLPNPALRMVHARWSAAGSRLRPVDAPVPPSGEIVFLDPAFRLVGYPRRDGSQIVAVGDGVNGSGAVDVTDLSIEVDLLRAIYAIVAAYGRRVLVSLVRPTSLVDSIVDRMILPAGRRGLLIALAPRL